MVDPTYLIKSFCIVAGASMTSVQSGLLAPATVEKLLTREYDEERRPGLYSETGKKWLEEHKGSHVALLVSQCFKREADWQVTSRCSTCTYVQDLTAMVQITLTTSIVIAGPFPEAQ